VGGLLVGIGAVMGSWAFKGHVDAETEQLKNTFVQNVLNDNVRLRKRNQELEDKTHVPDTESKCSNYFSV
jgi:hypothetical protein